MIGALKCQKCVILQQDLNALRACLSLYDFSVIHRRYATTSNRTHYDVLGISQDATESQIKNAFILKSKKTHPDLNPNDSSKHKEFVLLNEAYSVLRDPAKKREYDNTISNGYHTQAAYGRHHQSRHQAQARRHSPYNRQQYYTWEKEGPFTNWPKDEKGRYGFWDSTTGRYNFESPLGEEMKRWAENARSYQTPPSEEERQMNSLLRRKMIYFFLLVYFLTMYMTHTAMRYNPDLIRARRIQQEEYEIYLKEERARLQRKSMQRNTEDTEGGDAFDKLNLKERKESENYFRQKEPKLHRPDIQRSEEIPEFRKPIFNDSR